MQPIKLARYLLRDFSEEDRAAFLSYQCDPRYLALYDLDHDYARHANDLFDRFMAWSRTIPRTDAQLGIFDSDTGSLYGSAGLRDIADGSATFGIELAPQFWGRFGLALDVTAALLDYGFDILDLETVTGSTASGNSRVAKLACWFGATIIAEREGPDWMTDRGWREVDWSISRPNWRSSCGNSRMRNS